MKVPVFSIMADQLVKAVKGDESVFSLGVWPFGPNLLYKNLALEEVKTIRRHIPLRRYPAVIGVYYSTYIYAIHIPDNSERNAKRHAFWIISMTQEFGENFATKIGNAHEIGRPSSREDNEVDEHNNKAALQYAKNNPGVKPATAADEMWASGLLRGYAVSSSC